MTGEDTRIAYVVKVVRYAGRAATQIGGRLPVGFIRGSLQRCGGGSEHLAVSDGPGPLL